MRIVRPLLAMLCAATMTFASVGPAQGAAPEPDLILMPGEKGGFKGPCGVAVDSAGYPYISDYYRNAVQVYDPEPPLFLPAFLTAIENIDLLDGPCGLALDGAGNLYVNNFHRNVEKFDLFEYPAKRGSPLPFGASAGIVDSSHPTGVAVDPATGVVYVNARTYIAAYGPSGAPVMDGGEPLRIGEGSLQDGYGLAFSTFLGTAGLLYVPDAGDDTVKVYDPDGIDPDTPVATIDGSAIPGGGFVSLHDSAVAVDSVRGDVYVADTLGPQLSERPEATVYVFSAAGTYEGRLKYNVVDGGPPGIAVDESREESGLPSPTQGRVYVTSGNTDGAGLYAYPPDSATAFGEPATFPLGVVAGGDGSGSVVADQLPIECLGSCEKSVLAGAQLTLTAVPEPGSTFSGWSGGGCSGRGECVVTMDEARVVGASFEGPSAPPAAGPPVGSGAPSSPFGPGRQGSPATSSVVAQKGTLRVSVNGKLAPKRLPRDGAAPISVSVGGEISTTDSSLPPQLKSMRIELNREGRLDSTGLPNCNFDSIQPGSSSRALSACRSSLVGEGSFTANITLAGQEPYPTKGKLLVFNAREKGKPVLYGHIYAPRPFATSFVIVFAIQKLGKGTYGTALNAPLPAAMDAWGRLTGLQMTLSKRYAFKGKQRSFLSAGCPAPKGFTKAVFPLARTEFAFGGGRRLSSVLSSTCKVNGVKK